MSDRIRRLLRDVASGFHSGLDFLRWGHAYPRTLDARTLRRLRGGRMPAPRPLDPDEQRAILSPGRVSPQVRRFLSDEDIERVNQGRRP